MRVQYKLFSITLAASGLLVVLMLLLAQWSFDRGLLDYVNKRADGHYESLSALLKVRYDRDGNWDSLKRQRSWRMMLRDAGVIPDRPPRPKHEKRKPPKEPGGQGGKRPRPGPKQGEPIALTDTGKNHVAGKMPKKEHRRFREIRMEGQLIGYLVFAGRNHLTDDFDLNFSDQLNRNLWWIAGVMILLSASLALPFSAFLIRPLRPVGKAIHQLAKGNYSVRLKAQSGDEIGKVAEDINLLADALDKHDNSRKVWLAGISHELRTPLAVMRGELEAMLDGVREINRENIQSAHQEVMHLQHLVEDLYELTSNDIGALKYQKYELDLVGLTEDNMLRFSSLISGAGLAYELNLPDDCDHGLWIHADENRLSQLIHNLLNNSIKYTQVPGVVSVTLKKENGHALLIIEDSSPGVSTDELEKIFDHLYRAEQSRNRSTGGSGLGLAICRQIAEGHGGLLQAAHSPKGGIRMTLTLPLIDDGHSS